MCSRRLWHGAPPDATPPPASAASEGPTPPEKIALALERRERQGAPVPASRTGDGNNNYGINQVNCVGADGRHVYYDGGSRDNHPGTRGFTHSSGHSSAASGGNPRFTDAGIVAKMERGNGCTFDDLVTYHTNNSLGGY